MKTFAQEVVKSILSSEPVDSKLFDTFGGSAEDTQSAYSCVRFLLLSAVRFNVSKDVFSVELQQLGLTREHSLAIGKVFAEHSASLKNHLRNKSLAINELTDAKCRESEGIDCIKLSLIMTSNHSREINISRQDIPVLLKELKIIKNKMDQLDYKNE